jgi:DNA-binding NtrC family response regulator
MTHASQTVLLVDDDANLLTALRRALHAEPYEVLLAGTADAALWLLASRSVDVLVTDQHMPGMSGAEFLARVRAEHPQVVSLMLTGHGDLATAMQAINAGEVYRFFTKPCDVAALAAAIRQGLQLRASLRQGSVRLPLAPDEQNPDDADDATAPRVYEADASPTDLDALLREIQADLEASTRHDAGRPRRHSEPR